jgi:NAD-dependent dihydropyrimidine dehydrogenase PreA subunit/coenzyme F420-reducing hydrogenase delta subunit
MASEFFLSVDQPIVMSDIDSNQPEVFPGSNPEIDCVPDPGQTGTDGKRDTPVWQPQRSPVLRYFERISLVFESLVNRLARNARMNPFYHTGTLAVFLWLLVAASGLYLTMFYQFGFDVSYHAMEKLEASFVGRTIRALHNYGSGLAMIVSLLHGWRLLFMDRFRGPRWLAWVTGVVMMIFLWVDGVFGYWLVWDQRAQMITSSATAFLERISPFAPSFLLSLIQAATNGESWVFIISVWAVHFLLFAIVAGFFWFHIVRLSRPRFLPANYWMLVAALVLVVISAIFPLGLLPKASFDQLPGRLSLDFIFLFFIPLQEKLSPLVLWGILLVVGMVLSLLPWAELRRNRQPRVSIDKNRCTGCTKCALDCPYKAIQMAPRTDGKRHKYIAIENPDLCVSCGVCVGSCDVLAISVGGLSQEALWQALDTRLAHMREENATAPRVIFTCERHALHGAAPFLDQAGLQNAEPFTLIPLPCVAAAAPNLISHALDAGAAGVSVVGCPPDDCARREGNLWEELRLQRKRLPRLKKPYDQSPISTFWLAPDAFSTALEPVSVQISQETPAGANPRWSMFPELRWQDYAPAFLILAASLLLQIGLNRVSYQHPWSGQAVAQVELADPAQAFVHGLGMPVGGFESWPTRLSLRVDGQVIYEKEVDPQDMYAGAIDPLLVSIPLAPGKHAVRLAFDGVEGYEFTLVLYEKSVEMVAGQILRIQDLSGEVFHQKPGDGIEVK